jgi:hypothetical protein
MGHLTTEALRQDSAPLPPLRPLGPVEPAAEVLALPATPTWSRARVALLLFALVWACFAALAPTATSPGTFDVTHLGLVFIGVAVPLTWVGAEFQRGVRRQRVEQHANLAASWIARARHQAHQTVQSVHRHDLRSMLFVIDGAARTLADDTLSAEQRASFAEMLGEGVERLRTLIDVRSEEIEPFAVGDVAWAVVHAERRAGRAVKSDVPSRLTAVGRAADIAAVLRTLVAVTGRKTSADVRLRGDVQNGAVIVRIEPAGATELPLATEHWEEIRAETFKPTNGKDDASIDLYVAARLLADQGADVWSTTGRARFAVRLPLAAVPSSQEEA